MITTILRVVIFVVFVFAFKAQPVSSVARALHSQALAQSGWILFSCHEIHGQFQENQLVDD
jgi:hypothetical protein